MRALILCRFISTLIVVFFLTVALAGNGAQRSTNPTAAPPPSLNLPKQLPDNQANPQDPAEAARRKEMQKGLDKERNKEIQKETDQLLQLATELKKSVDAAVEGDTLSLQVIKKTDEIEKLAKKVRTKMKETYEVPGPNLGRWPDASNH